METVFTYYGHATLGLHTAETKLIIDPWFSGNPWVKFSAEDVNADYLLVTHAHGDHLGDTVAIAKRTDATVISNFEICEWLGEQGIKTHSMHLGGDFQSRLGESSSPPQCMGLPSLIKVMVEPGRFSDHYIAWKENLSGR